MLRFCGADPFYFRRGRGQRKRLAAPRRARQRAHGPRDKAKLRAGEVRCSYRVLLSAWWCVQASGVRLHTHGAKHREGRACWAPAPVPRRPRYPPVLQQAPGHARARPRMRPRVAHLLLDPPKPPKPIMAAISGSIPSTSSASCSFFFWTFASFFAFLRRSSSARCAMIRCS